MGARDCSCVLVKLFFMRNVHDFLQMVDVTNLLRADNFSACVVFASIRNSSRTLATGARQIP
jgi:hypothetical protein